MEPRVIVASRTLILQSAGVALAVVGLGAGLAAIAPLDRGGHASRSWGLGAGLVGIVMILGGFVGLVTSVLHLLRPASLTLTAEALIVDAGLGGGERRIAWRDVERFYVRMTRTDDPRYRFPGLSGPTESAGVAVKYATAGGLFSLAGSSDAGFGREAVLPMGDFAMSATALVDLLNDYRSRVVAMAPSGEGA